jgi:hypothetical protein
MTTTARTFTIWIAVAVAAVVAVALGIKLRSRTLAITGVILRQDSDPRKQLPIPDVNIAVAGDASGVATVSDGSGFFNLKLPNNVWRGRQVTLTLRHPDYRPATIPLSTPTAAVLRMTPNAPIAASASSPTGPPMLIKDVRVRYSEKASSVNNVGSVAKTFTVTNIGGIACESKPPCSPDGKWKASQGGVTLDAGEGQQFENARVSCIAGPCPFTSIDTGATPQSGRNITVRVTNWSDTTTFLVEAEVTRSTPSDAIRQAYPAIFGRSMSFTLPATAEGPSIEADLGGAEIVFPLGPALRLSWANCTLQVAADQTKLYLCQLKPGYQFQ